MLNLFDNSFSKSDNAEYFYLQYKYAADKDFSEKDKKRLDELHEKYIAECERQAYWNKRAEEKKT